MSSSDGVDPVDKPDLFDHVTLLQPADLTFLDHVHRLIPGDRVQRASNRPEPQARRDSLFDESVILLHHIVQGQRWPTGPGAQFRSVARAACSHHCAV